MQLLTRPTEGHTPWFHRCGCTQTLHHCAFRLPALSTLIFVLLATGCGSERPIPIRDPKAQGSLNPSSPPPGSPGDKDPDSKEDEKQSAEQKGNDGTVPLSPSELLKQAGEEQALLSLAPTIESYRLTLNSSIQTLAAKTETLGRVQGVNSLLCSKHQEQAASCPLLHQLLIRPSDQSNSLTQTCKPYQEKAESATAPELTRASLWISLTIGGSNKPERFFLRANKGTLLSSEFASGSKTTLSWTSSAGGESPKLFPTLADLSDLQIAPATAPKMPEWKSGTTLEMGIHSTRVMDGQTVMDESKLISSAALLPWKQNAIAADIALAELGNWNSNSRCLITEAQIDSLVASAKPQTTPNPSASQKIEKREFRSFAEAEEALQIYTSRMKETKSALTEIDGDLQRENEKGIKLRAQLRSSKVSTCHAPQPLRNIEIYLKGAHLADSDWDRSSTEIEKTSEGMPERFEINLGTKVSLVNPSEEASPIFSANGFLASNAYEALSAMDVDFIRIKKMGTGFRSTLNCWTIIGWSRWGLGKKCEYQNSETNRYRMDSLLIRIDGRDFYRSESLNFSFSGEDRTWEEARLSNSQEYTNFMTNELCKGGT